MLECRKLHWCIKALWAVLEWMNWKCAQLLLFMHMYLCPCCGTLLWCCSYTGLAACKRDAPAPSSFISALLVWWVSDPEVSQLRDIKWWKINFVGWVLASYLSALSHCRVRNGERSSSCCLAKLHCQITPGDYWPKAQWWICQPSSCRKIQVNKAANCDI